MTCEVVRFDYESHDGRATRRRAEPYRLVSHQRRWYLVAWDLDRDDWRTFRVDRVAPRTPTGPRFTPRPTPSDHEVVQRVERAAGEAMWRFRARVVVHAPAAHVRARMPIPVDIEELGEDRCAFEPGSDDPRALALWLGFLDADFEVESEDLKARAASPRRPPRKGGRTRPKVGHELTMVAAQVGSPESWPGNHRDGAESAGSLPLRFQPESK